MIQATFGTEDFLNRYPYIRLALLKELEERAVIKRRLDVRWLSWEIYDFDILDAAYVADRLCCGVP